MLYIFINIIQFIISHIDFDTLFLFFTRKNKLYEQVIFILTSHLLSIYLLNDFFIFNMILDIISVIALRKLNINFLPFIIFRHSYSLFATYFKISCCDFLENFIITFIVTIAIKKVINFLTKR